MFEKLAELKFTSNFCHVKDKFKVLCEVLLCKMSFLIVLSF